MWCEESHGSLDVFNGSYRNWNIVTWTSNELSLQCFHPTLSHNTFSQQCAPLEFTGLHRSPRKSDLVFQSPKRTPAEQVTCFSGSFFWSLKTNTSEMAYSDQHITWRRVAWLKEKTALSLTKHGVVHYTSNVHLPCRVGP